jgi:hypothetical protein
MAQFHGVSLDGFFWDTTQCKSTDVLEEHVSSILGFAYCFLHGSFLHSLLFNPEDGGNMLLRNVG